MACVSVLFRSSSFKDGSIESDQTLSYLNLNFLNVSCSILRINGATQLSLGKLH